MGLLTEMLQEAFIGRLNEAADMKDIINHFKKIGHTYKRSDWNAFMDWVKANFKVISNPDMTKVATIQFMISKKTNEILEIILSRPGLNGEIDGIAQVDFYGDNTWGFISVKGYKDLLKKWRGNNPVICYEIPLEVAKSVFPKSVLRDKTGCINVAQ